MADHLKKKLRITNPSEILVSSNIRPFNNSTSDNF